MEKILNSLFLIALITFQLLPGGIVLYNSYFLSQWDESPGWITDKETDCKYYTNVNFQNRTIDWEGNCNQDLADGKGKLTIYEGGLPLLQFEGELEMGRIDGYGRLVYLSDGDVFEGQFSNGKINGFGHFYNDDGDHFEGYFLNGERTGYGTYWYEPDQTIFKYVGHWKHNKMNGEGTIFYRNGTKVEGIFKDDEILSAHPISEVPVSAFPKNVLITNDDGVEDMNRLICLAEEMSSFADMVVIAVSNENKSGTSNSMAAFNQGYLETTCLSIDTINNIYIYEVKGYPADCIMLGAGGIFHEADKTIDLVISGINGGANSGAEWFGSGTIGAARTAALARIPAIAVSGIDEDTENPGNLKKICKWVAELAQSEIVLQMKPFEYLTISIPENVEKIKGSKILERAITFDNAPFYFQRTEGTISAVGKSDLWKISPNDPSTVYDMSRPLDVVYYHQDYITIVPMSVDENNRNSLSEYQKLEETLPQINSEK